MSYGVFFGGATVVGWSSSFLFHRDDHDTMLRDAVVTMVTALVAAELFGNSEGMFEFDTALGKFALGATLVCSALIPIIADRIFDAVKIDPIHEHQRLMGG